MKCAASDALITSATKMLAAYSCARRWNWRSEPVRSIRTAIPGYFASKPRATRSDTGRSIAAYQTTLLSFFAASITAGVTGTGSGAAAHTRADEAANAAAATDALTRSRRERPVMLAYT